MSRASRQLLDQARDLAELGGRGRPRQVDLRRAVSSAYYGLFRLLIDAACAEFAGSGPTARPLRDALARAFDHGTMKSACGSFAGGTLPEAMQPALLGQTTSADLRRLADAFVRLQKERHDADYNPALVYSRHEVRGLVSDVAELHDDLWPTIAGSNEARVFLWSLLLHKSLARR